MTPKWEPFGSLLGALGTLGLHKGAPWSKNGAKSGSKLRFVDFVKMSVFLGKTLYFEGLGRRGCSKWAPSGAHGRHLGLKVEPLEHRLGMQISSRIFECLFGGFRRRGRGEGGWGGPTLPPETTLKGPAASP